MSYLTSIEKLKLEKLLEKESGYVLKKNHIAVHNSLIYVQL
ncbi:hypothetical protein E5S67_03409 [Microcoleus sp. IPMA8]|uniref:Transposase n=1 Tax=Microcoleus asticus IPMA8 TaxID=2563858 RepID=A0ABX2CZD0_9CYAN|nr:hypothetical protein [Microcoleus asticus IPMA8]